MAERLTPGVYVEEVSGGVRPIQGVSTSTAAFIGEAPRGIPDRAQFVNGFREFERRFGGHRRGPAGFLAQAVEAFFAAGGRRAFVVRVLPADATAGATPAPIAARADDAWGIRRNVLRFDAQGNGAWADHIRIHIEPSTSFADRAFRIRVEWTEGGRSRTVETFDNVVMDPEHEDYAVRVVNETSQYLRATDLFETEFLGAEERTQPPIPERLPALASQPSGDDEYRVPLGAALQFTWRDLASGRGTDLEDPPTVPLDADAVETAGGTLDGRDAVLTAAQFAALLTTALGDDFRVADPDDDDVVRIEPAVASRAYLVVQPANEADETFDLAAVDTVRVTAANGEGNDAETYDVDVTDAAADNLTPAELAQRITAAIEAAENPYDLTAEAAGRFLTLRAGPSADGVTLTIEAVGGAAPWTDPVTVAGAAGLEVDSLNAVELTVGEVIQLGVARALSRLFPITRAAGLVENQPGNPDLRPALTEDTPLRLVGGSDGAGEVGVAQYRGDVTDQGRTGMRAFDTADINMLAMPGRNTPDFLAVAMAYCDRRDVFFVADGVGSIDQDFEISADEVRRIVEGLPARSNNAAMFYPWVEVPDPVGVGRNPRRLVPPSGHVAGIFARTDVTRGVWKAPAGIEALVSGAVDVQHHLIDADQDLLNPIGLNCIRQFPNVGIVSWGSRTLASDPEWRYVPVRRTALFLKESLRRGLQWAVFEPNDQELWDRIRINITAFMLGLFRQGAFQGATPDEAFLVKCDRETNPQELIDQGIVTAQVAFAPLKPAEFVVIEISQKSLLAV
jgi:Bacteriophage tail sheath protein